MADLEGFSKRMGVLARKVEAGGVDAARKVALAADAAIVTGTPVDEGRARSNWVVEIDRAAEGTRQPYAPGKGLGKEESANRAGALAQAAAKIAQFGPNNTEIHITNNLPYIERLNQGSSKQAPENFVEDALAAAARAVKGVRLLEG